MIQFAARWLQVIAFGLLLPMAAAAQQPYYKKYTQEDGFPSTVVYSIVQDRQHFLWFSTENGVCRFDGRRIAHYTPANSRFDLGIFYLYCDTRGRIWAVSIFSPPCYYSNNRFYTLPKKLQQAARNTRWMLEDSKGTLYFLTRDGDIIRWRGGADFTSVKVAPSGGLSAGAVINDTMLVANAGTDMFIVTASGKVQQLPIQGYAHEANRLYKLKNGVVIGYGRDGIYQFTPNGYKMICRHNDPYSSISYGMHAVNDSTIWLATRDGIHVFHYSGDSMRLTGKILPAKTVLSIYKDHNGNYWLSVPNDAVYFLNAVHNRYYTFGGRETNITDISFTGNTGHVFASNGDHYLVEKDSPMYAGNVTDMAPTYTYRKTMQVSGNNILIMYRGGNMIISGRHKLYTAGAAHIPPATNYYYRNDGKFFAGLTENGYCTVSQVCDTGVITIVRTAVPDVSGLDKHFCFDYSNRCWGSLADTLVCIEPAGSGKGRLTRYPTHGIFIADIRCDARNNVWVATRGAGLYCITPGRHLIKYSVEQGLVSNFCSQLYIDADDNLWVCSQNGLNKIYRDRNGRVAIQSFTKDNLLPAPVVNCVYKKGNMVYAGTPGGLFVFEDMVVDTGIVSCYISGVSADGKPLPVQDHYSVPFGQSVNIGFSTVDFNQSAPPVFHYRLEGAEAHWNTTTAAQVQYGQLKPGQYTFRIYSGRYPAGQVSLSLLVLTPFWLQWWFITAVILLLLAASFGASYIVMRVKHRKASQANRMLANDLKSLRAQINPHFIFNALNSIQDFILDQQPRIANHYLTRFARLMRMIVDNSQKEWIALSGEIYFLQLYLELEQLRLGDSFSFNIITDANIDADALHIPPMLIQPIAENSIKHGLSGKAGNKQLEIHFSLQQAFVYCRIKDNGNGREHAQMIAAKNTTRQSMGIENIRERLQLLYPRQHAGTEPVVITDLYDGMTPAGTLVEIFIPYFIDN